MNAWGDAWGASWGGAWGTADVSAVPPDSPFQAGGVAQWLPSIGSGKKLCIQVQSGSTFLLYIKRDGVASAGAADYFMTAGERLSIPGPCTVSCINITGNPRVYWTLEDKERR